MILSPQSPWLLVALGLGVLACEPGGVGDPCIPEDEYHTDFAGYGEKEANVETKSFQCITRVCLVNHFRGRVSCSYGQNQAEASGTAQCFVPGTFGNQADKISVPVPAQFVDRQTDKAVYCSCRCDGPDENARYCECPSGFACIDLVPDLGTGLGGGQLAGSYCVKEGTEYNASNPPVGDCDRADGLCEPANL